jgi:hypothetical protein
MSKNTKRPVRERSVSKAILYFVLFSMESATLDCSHCFESTKTPLPERPRGKHSGKTLP